MTYKGTANLAVDVPHEVVGEESVSGRLRARILPAVVGYIEHCPVVHFGSGFMDFQKAIIGDPLISASASCKITWQSADATTARIRHQHIPANSPCHFHFALPITFGHLAPSALSLSI